jgi:hypothetical protein
MWVAIHKCMEATLGISLYGYLDLKLAKTLSFLLSLQQNRRSRGQNRFCPGAGGRGEVRGGGPNNVYTCRYKNGKIIKKKKLKLSEMK